MIFAACHSRQNYLFLIENLTYKTNSMEKTLSFMQLDLDLNFHIQFQYWQSSHKQSYQSQSSEVCFWINVNMFYYEHSLFKKIKWIKFLQYISVIFGHISLQSPFNHLSVPSHNIKLGLQIIFFLLICYRILSKLNTSSHKADSRQSS